jgi:AAA15 family ATPase/GTPase
MLQQFTVENFLSFKDREVFKLQPGRGTRKKEHKAEPVKGHWILKSAALFGPNAGGKSNFVEALELGKRLVLLGTSAESLIDYRPFRLCAESKKKDTTITYQILCNNKKYEYGFSYNAERISKEWLKQITRKTEHVIFSRDITATELFNISYLIKLNPKEEERQFLSFFAKATPQHQLFLHEVISRNLHDNVSNIEDLWEVIRWFVDTLKVLFPNTSYKQGGMLKAMNDEQLKDMFHILLLYFDTGIQDIDFIDVEFDKLGITQEMKQFIKTDLSKSSNAEAFGALRFDNNLYLISLVDSAIKAKKLQTLHKRIDDKEREYFSLGDESDGTQRIFDYIPLILDLIQGKKVFIVDEMERSLHPVLMRKLIELFFKYSNNISTQLIFTTHESTLMDQELLRRDEIWMVEKNTEGVSSLSRLDEKFNLRFDKELEKSYLKGLFGATPNLSDETAIQELRGLLAK